MNNFSGFNISTSNLIVNQKANLTNKAKMMIVTSKVANSLAKLGRSLRIGGTLVCLVLSLFIVNLHAAQMNGIEFISSPNGDLQIKMDFDAEPPEPSSYNIEKPARISLDLPGVKSGLERKKYNLSHINAQSVVVLEAADRTRVIVNLLEMSPYDIERNGNSLSVNLGSKSTQGVFVADSGSYESDAIKSDTPALAITNVDFQRGESGEGNLVLGLSDDRVDVDIRLDGRMILVEFADTNAAQALARSYDVLDFATPVKRFQVNQVGRDTQILLEPQGDYDYLAYQTDTTYVLSVRPLTQEEVEEKRRAFAFTGEKLSLNFQDIKVRSVLQLIADFTGLNLVTSDSVKGSITLRLQDVPWDQALDLILKTKGLDKRQVGNVLMVAPAAEIAEREFQEIETRKQLEELAPLQTEFIRIRYASAGDIFNLFQGEEGDSGLPGEGASEATGATGSILSPRGRVVVDERTNTIVITDTAEKIEEFKYLINNIDVPLRQVLVEARIVIANDSFDEQIGVQWGGGTADQGTGDRYAITGSLNSLLSEAGADADERTDIFSFVNGNGSIEFPDANFIDLGVSSNIGQPQSFALGYLSDNAFLGLELSAIAAEGRGEVVSQPKLITGDKQEAEIKTGEEIPFIESSASGRSTVKFREAVLSLKVTPSITPDNRLILDLVVKQDSRSEDLVFGENNSSVPIILKNEIKTQALVDNGKTIVLGGVFREAELEQETKVPLLGDLPLLGRLFKRTTVNNDKNELLIFITPRILSDRVLD